MIKLLVSFSIKNLCSFKGGYIRVWDFTQKRCKLIIKFTR